MKKIEITDQIVGGGGTAFCKTVAVADVAVGAAIMFTTFTMGPVGWAAFAGLNLYCAFA